VRRKGRKGTVLDMDGLWRKGTHLDQVCPSSPQLVLGRTVPFLLPFSSLASATV